MDYDGQKNGCSYLLPRFFCAAARCRAKAEVTIYTSMCEDIIETMVRLSLRERSRGAALLTNRIPEPLCGWTSTNILFLTMTILEP